MVGQETGIPFDQLLGPYGLLVFLILMFYILGRFALTQINDMRTERDFWREKALKLLETASSAVETAVRLSPDSNIEEMARTVDAARKRGQIR